MSIPRSWIRLESAVAVALAVVDVTEDVTLAAFEPYVERGMEVGGWGSELLSVGMKEVGRWEAGRQEKSGRDCVKSDYYYVSDRLLLFLSYHIV